jgi:hypothetical protein
MPPDHPWTAAKFHGERDNLRHGHHGHLAVVWSAASGSAAKQPVVAERYLRFVEVRRRLKQAIAWPPRMMTPMAIWGAQSTAGFSRRPGWGSTVLRRVNYVEAQAVQAEISLVSALTRRDMLHGGSSGPAYLRSSERDEGRKLRKVGQSYLVSNPYITYTKRPIHLHPYRATSKALDPTTTAAVLRLPNRLTRNPAICCRAGGRPEAARRAGLEFVEKLLTRSSQHGHDGAERWHAARSPASRSPAVLVELPTGAGSSSSWSCSPSPTEARPQLLGDDLDGDPALGSPRSSPQAQASPGGMYV